ncbi:MAG: hypothetical protein ACI81S_001208 [Sphingobacteriales bacterium]|jgi:hypothetical protein
MKKLFTVCFLAIFISPAFSQISNASFEKWDTVKGGPYEYHFPTDWLSFDELGLRNGEPQDTSTVFNVEGRNGSRALKLYLPDPLSNKTAAAFLFLQHTDKDQNKKIGVPISSKPTSLSGFYKSNISGTDSFSFVIFVGKISEDPNGSGYLSFNGEVNTFTSFEIPITYSSDDPADSLYIVIANFSETRLASMELILDDLSLSYDPVGIDNKEIDISFYPNPVSNVLNLDLKSFSTHEFSTLEIVDLNGRVLFLTNEITEKINLPASLKAGTYLIRLKGDKNIFIKKLVKI